MSGFKTFLGVSFVKAIQLQENYELFATLNRGPGSLQKLYCREVASLKCIEKYLPDQNMALSILYSETYWLVVWVLWIGDTKVS